MKKLENLVSDIYSVLSPLTEGEALDISDEDIDDFGEAIKDVVRHWATPKARDSNTLRMSNIGKPSRQLWYDLKYKREESSFEYSHLPIKFLYGHLLEEVLLFLVKMADIKLKMNRKK